MEYILMNSEKLLWKIDKMQLALVTNAYLIAPH